MATPPEMVTYALHAEEGVSRASIPLTSAYFVRHADAAKENGQRPPSVHRSHGSSAKRAEDVATPCIMLTDQWTISCPRETSDLE